VDRDASLSGEPTEAGGDRIRRDVAVFPGSAQEAVAVPIGSCHDNEVL